MKYRKKPVVIEAFRWLPKAPASVSPDWFYEACWNGTVRIEPDDTVAIKTLEGEMVCNVGDWLIRGIKGELYPCKPDIFEASYEVAE